MVSVILEQFAYNSVLVTLLNSYYYGNQIARLNMAAKSVGDRFEIKAKSIIDFSKHIVWIDHNGDESHDAHGLVNHSEVKIVNQLVGMFAKTTTVGKKDIGVVTFFTAQKAALEASMADEVEVNIAETCLADWVKDVAIISAVRSNKAGDLGLLADQRRLNVACTRGSSMLIIVANAETVTSIGGFAAILLDAAKKVGQVFSYDIGKKILEPSLLKNVNPPKHTSLDQFNKVTSRKKRFDGSPEHPGKGQAAMMLMDDDTPSFSKSRDDGARDHNLGQPTTLLPQHGKAERESSFDKSDPLKRFVIKGCASVLSVRIERQVDETEAISQRRGGHKDRGRMS